MGRHAHATARTRPGELGLAGRRQHLAGVRLRQARFAGDTWTYELRPIIDKEMGPWYVSINPVLEKSLRGPTSSTPFVLQPERRRRLSTSRSRINLAVEYYGATGTDQAPRPDRRPGAPLYGAVNLDLGPAWEFNFGVGIGADRRRRQAVS